MSARDDDDARLVAVLESEALPAMTSVVKLAGIRREWPPAPILLRIADDFEQESPARAAELYRVAATLRPEDAQVLNHVAWQLLVFWREELRDPKAALPLARKAVHLTKGEDHMILDTLALALFETGHLLEAIRIQEKAVAMHPEEPEYRERLARFRARVAAL